MSVSSIVLFLFLGVYIQVTLKQAVIYCTFTLSVQMIYQPAHKHIYRSFQCLVSTAYIQYT